MQSLSIRIVIFLSLVSLPALSLNSKTLSKAENAEEVHKQVKQILRRFIKGIGEDPKKYQLEIHHNKELNAYATLGKKIVVNDGLIDFIDSEAGLAFVIAHELGHLEERHLINGLMRNNFGAFLRAFVFKNHVIAQSLDYFHGLHFGRGAEKEADLFAEDLMKEFYCNEPGKLEFFEKMAERRKADKLSEYFSTHPLPQSRLKYLREEIQATGCVL